MKDKQVRFYIKRVLAAGITAVIVLSVLALLIGGVWGKIGVAAVLLLPLSRLSTEVYGFTKTGKYRYAIISTVLIIMILSSFTFAYFHPAMRAPESGPDSEPAPAVAAPAAAAAAAVTPAAAADTGR